MTIETNILVVDDSAPMRHALQTILASNGYQVTTAQSGGAALELIDMQEFDLALLDLRLTDMTGLDILAYLRACSPDTVVIILTAHASLESVVQAMQQGAKDYLFKPCQPVELWESIARALSDRREKMDYRTRRDQTFGVCKAKELLTPTACQGQPL